MTDHYATEKYSNKLLSFERKLVDFLLVREKEFATYIYENDFLYQISLYLMEVKL